MKLLNSESLRPTNPYKHPTAGVISYQNIKYLPYTVITKNSQYMVPHSNLVTQWVTLFKISYINYTNFRGTKEKNNKNGYGY